MKTILLNKKIYDRPNIKLTVMRCEPNVWIDLEFFRHHYLTTSLNKSCKCLVFLWNGTPIAFVGLLNTPRKGMPYGFAISRIVINPDYQGLGLSHRILDFCGGILKSLGNEYFLYIKTIHEKMGNSLERNPKWQPTCYNGKVRKVEDSEQGKYNNRLIRKSYCYKYVGEAIYGYEELLKPIKELRDKKSEDNANKLLNKAKREAIQLELFDW